MIQLSKFIFEIVNGILRNYFTISIRTFCLLFSFGYWINLIMITIFHCFKSPPIQRFWTFSSTSTYNFELHFSGIKNRAHCINEIYKPVHNFRLVIMLWIFPRLMEQKQIKTEENLTRMKLGKLKICLQLASAHFISIGERKKIIFYGFYYWNSCDILKNKNAQW